MKILGYPYTLELDKTSKELGNNQGLCDLQNLQISVASDIPDDAKASVVVHEIIEALNYHLELGLKHRQIMALEVGIHQALSENGVSLRCLLDDKKEDKCQITHPKV